MITQSTAIQELYILALSLTSDERFKAAGSFTRKSSFEGFFTAFAIISLLIAVALLFWLFRKYKRTEHSLNQKITDLTIKNVELRQKNTELNTANEQLQEENNKLHEENAELYRKQAAALENTITANEANPTEQEASQSTK